MELSPLEPEAAPLGHRVAARIVDVVVHYGVIFYTAIWLSIVAAVAVPDQMEAITAKLGENTFFGVTLGVLGSVLYHTCMEGIHGSSIGKRLFGLTVLSEDGGPCSLRQGWKRSLAFLLDSFFFGMIGYSAARNSPRKQRVGDEWADTVVVRTRSVPAPLRRSGRELFAAFAGGFACDFVFVALGLILGYLVG
jgi:uncharacterized RDD family membrane protein YckC